MRLFITSLLLLLPLLAEENPFDYKTHLQPPSRATLARGSEIYANLCVNCHGKDGLTPQLPIATAFTKGPYKFGSDPVSLMKTLSFGNGLMGPQTWMTEAERFAVIHHIRETYQKGTPHLAPIDMDKLPATVAKPKADPTNPQRDFGPALASQYKREVESALTVRLSDDWSLAVDLHTMDRVGVWQDGFLDLSRTQHMRGRGEGTPAPAGEPIPALSTWKWAHGGRFDYPTENLLPRGPMPDKWMHLLGHTVVGDRVVLHYTIDGRRIWEMPYVAAGANAISTSLRVAPGDTELSLSVGDKVTHLVRGTGLEATKPGTGTTVGRFVAIGTSDGTGTSIKISKAGHCTLTFPASTETRRITIHQSTGEGQPALDSFAGFLDYVNLQERPDPAELANAGGPLNWPEIIETPIERGADDAPYTLDRIVLPRDNPWNAWMRTSALAFFPDGRMAVSTHGGDVWIVSGLDTNTAKWKRFAAGMYEPFGLQVIDGRVYVTCKDRLVRLHDHNEDGEADFYESFSADEDVSVFFHAFNFDLQRDAEGNLYYAKSGQYTDYRLPGSVIKVSPDGKRRSVHCTGFRTPNGMGILPDGRVTVSDNQGSWMPASKVSLCEPGGFYGYVQTHSAGPNKWQPDGGKIDPKKVVPPKTFDPPIIWMPQEVDNSSGGQLWVDDERWGPLAGKLIHTSFGKGWMYYFMLQEINGTPQSTLVKLPLDFDTGIQRARVNPADGQVYATGLDGWNGGGRRGLTDGGIQRVRYTGTPAPFLLDTEVKQDAITFTFNVEVDPTTVGTTKLEQWNYKWLARYGSDQWSVKDPTQKGRDPLVPADIRTEGKQVTLHLPGLQPVHQLRVMFDLKSKDGTPFKQEALMTINKVPGR